MIFKEMFPYTLNRDRKLHCTKADRTQYLNSSNLFNSLTKSELEMCKIQTSKLTHTEHHENTWSQVSTDFLPKPSQQSRTQISPQHNESQTREENPKKKKKKKRTQQMVFGYTMCVWMPVWLRKNKQLLVIILCYHQHTLAGESTQNHLTCQLPESRGSSG